MYASIHDVCPLSLRVARGLSSANRELVFAPENQSLLGSRCGALEPTFSGLTVAGLSRAKHFSLSGWASGPTFVFPAVVTAGAFAPPKSVDFFSLT